MRRGPALGAGFEAAHTSVLPRGVRVQEGGRREGDVHRQSGEAGSARGRKRGRAQGTRGR